jgi:hypothetical protein
MKPEPALARHRVRAVSHEPQHPFGTDISPREPQTVGPDIRHAQHHRRAAWHNQNAATRLQRNLERGLYADKCCPHVGVPGGRKLLPALFVDRHHRQPRAGIEDQNVGPFIADDVVHERRIGRENEASVREKDENTVAEEFQENDEDRDTADEWIIGRYS